MKPPIDRKANAAKARASKIASQKERDGQTIAINRKWKIIHADELNWAIPIPNSDEVWYYGRLVDALKALPHKILDTHQMTTVDQALKAMKSVQKLMQSLRAHEFAHLSDNIEGA